MPTRVRYRVHERGIQSMFMPAGQINRFGRQRVSADITRSMRSFALRNMRTGALLKSFSTSSEVRKNAVRFTLSSSVDHALFLERGTRPQRGVVLYQDVGVLGPGGKLITGGIVGGRGRAAANPRWHAWIGAPMRQVAGIRPRRFMSKALRDALRAHGLA